jgi:hypothetical protein
MALNDPLVHELSMEDYMAAAVGLHGRTPGYYGNLAQAARNWLVDHEGWGPKPTVSADRVCEDIDCCGRNTVITRLRECGIEVTDGG